MDGKSINVLDPEEAYLHDILGSSEPGIPKYKYPLLSEAKAVPDPEGTNSRNFHY